LTFANLPGRVFGIVAGDELFSDSFPVQLIDGVVYRVKGKVGVSAFILVLFTIPKRVKFLYAVVSILGQSFGRKTLNHQTELLLEQWQQILAVGCTHIAYILNKM